MTFLKLFLKNASKRSTCLADCLPDWLADHWSDRLKDLAMQTADGVISFIPFSQPSRELLEKAKVVAHRGYCGKGAKENTLQAFRDAIAAGSWGVEFDIRWTSDNVPVVTHDPTAQRVFNKALEISALDFQTLRRELPEIPTLQEVIDICRGRAHMMIEVKEVLTEKQAEILRDHLKKFIPEKDFHIISIRLPVLMSYPHVPRTALIPVAEFNTAELHRAVIDEKLGGLTGQYLLLGSAIVRAQKQQSLKVGTGFISSKSCLHRELNRGVDWIFTNHAAEVQKMINSELQR
jgi:glycerophosphoryl diester phosphodiesterase